jgi:hypothetical protein
MIMTMTVQKKTYSIQVHIAIALIIVIVIADRTTIVVSKNVFTQMGKRSLSPKYQAKIKWSPMLLKQVGLLN